LSQAGVQWHSEFHAGNPTLLSGAPVLEAFLAASAQVRDGPAAR
jgi:hypothetical protein